ncbi:sugar transferase [Microbispora sp. NPDC004025]
MGTGDSSRRAGPVSPSPLPVWQLFLGDVACVLAAGGIVILVFGLLAIFPVSTAEILVSIALVALWPATLALMGAYRERVYGEGSEEFHSIFKAAAILLAAASIAAYLFGLYIARSHALTLLSLTFALTVLSRHSMRRLRNRQAKGEGTRRLVVAGYRAQVSDLVTQFRRQPNHGMQVVGVCLVDAESDINVHDLPTLGTLRDLGEAAALVDADAVVVLASPALDGTALRRLVEDLQARHVDLLIAPTVIDIAKRRLSVRSVAGMPLLQVEVQESRSASWWVKAVFDRIVAAVALVTLSLPMIAIALIIRATSLGPALHRQTRIGKGGREFQALKFRTMVVDADQLKNVLLDDVESSGMLFQIRPDPRITRVGAFLRRYSLDELPLLINVLRGEMSLVGPRPPLPVEVDMHGPDMRQRLRVKPGMVGLWRVSGISDLSWEDMRRLDERYLQNWSLTLDLQILWKSIIAALGS